MILKMLVLIVVYVVISLVVNDLWLHRRKDPRWWADWLHDFIEYSFGVAVVIVLYGIA